ncbi:hypothetical protein DFJ77DRAFT_86093 [Powellomyces hirtus]|nr:hypothetical protein DFJ77DRAFT_86093 [Powellomyces hirtus]
MVERSYACLPLSDSNTQKASPVEAPEPWQAVHDSAVEQGKETYEDPATGYSVFTTLAHKNRGYCCGNKCRHCPFEYENVGHPKRTQQQATEHKIRKQSLRKEARAARAASANVEVQIEGNSSEDYTSSDEEKDADRQLDF